MLKNKSSKLAEVKENARTITWTGAGIVNDFWNIIDPNGNSLNVKVSALKISNETLTS